MSDDIEDKPQPLIEHLIELRTRLIWSLGAFFLAFIVCFFFAKHLFNLLVIPYKWAVIWAHLDVSKAELIYTAPQSFLHPGQGGDVFRHGHRFSGDCRADL